MISWASFGGFSVAPGDVIAIKETAQNEKLSHTKYTAVGDSQDDEASRICLYFSKSQTVRMKSNTMYRV